MPPCPPVLDGAGCRVSCGRFIAAPIFLVFVILLTQLQLRPIVSAHSTRDEEVCPPVSRRGNNNAYRDPSPFSISIHLYTNTKIYKSTYPALDATFRISDVIKIEDLNRCVEFYSSLIEELCQLCQYCSTSQYDFCSHYHHTHTPGATPINVCLCTVELNFHPHSV